MNLMLTVHCCILIFLKLNFFCFEFGILKQSVITRSSTQLTVAIDFHNIFSILMEGQWLPSTFWLPKFFKCLLLSSTEEETHTG